MTEAEWPYDADQHHRWATEYRIPVPMQQSSIGQVRKELRRNSRVAALLDMGGF